MAIAAQLRISAVGDIAFEGSEADLPALSCFEGVRTAFARSDLVVGNLECVLTGGDGARIPGKCTLRGHPEWARVLKQAGIGLVSLANNHVMDYGPDGLRTTMAALRAAGVEFVGAGQNSGEAHAPIILKIAGRTVAFLARSAIEVSAPTAATDDAPGVALLDVAQTIEAIRICRKQADLVVFMVHWGIEEYSYPSTAQRELARQFIAAGADLILGHHPHVLQGMEAIGSGTVVYSLGNFVFSEFEWPFCLPDGTPAPQISPLSTMNRAGIIASFAWREVAVPTITTEFTTIGDRGTVSMDNDVVRKPEWEMLCAGLTRSLYGPWWRWYALRREWMLRLGEQASPSRILANLHRIRFRHVVGLFAALRRSLRIVAEKTTNPYE